MMYLKVRPYPQEDESLPGYLLRLSDDNGYYDITHILELIEASRSHISTIHYWQYDCATVFIERLAPLLKRDVEKVFPAYRHQYSDQLIFEENRLIQDLRVTHLRLCPKCLHQKGTFDWRWSMAHIAHCQEHQCLLIDTCPHCNEPLDLKTEIFTHCPSCKAPWESMEVPKQSITQLEKESWEKLAHSPVKKDRMTDVIILTILFLARPYDSTFRKCLRLPKLTNYSELVALAYRILTTQEAMDEWAMSCLDLRRNISNLGPVGVFLPIHNWLWEIGKLGYEYPHHIPEDICEPKTCPSFQEYDGFIAKPRLKLSENPEDLRYQFPADGLPRLFPQCVLSYPEMRKAFVSAMYFNPHRFQRTFLDLRKLSSQLESVMQKHSEDWVKVSYQDETKGQDSSFADVIDDLLSQQIEGAIEDLSFQNIFLPRGKASELFLIHIDGD